MKSLTIGLFLINICCLFSSYTHAQEKPQSDNILIVYVSRTNNAKAVAEMIQKQVGGDLVALELENPYPENYQEIVAQVDRENEEGFLPELKTNIKGLENYDTVFLGFPTWDIELRFCALISNIGINSRNRHKSNKLFVLKFVKSK